MITLDKLTKVADSNFILNGISLTIDSGDVIGVIGPSGGGKSTLLRCIAGIESYTSGEINISPQCRIGMIFQSFNLFKNMSVMENLCYPQRKLLNRTKQNAEGVALNILKRVNMVHCFNRYPNQLSGGQQQRIAIARTLCLDPSIILLDEPTSALDPENVLEILSLIREISCQDVAMLIVSHELRFIEAITNKIIFMNNGQVETLCDTKYFFKHSDNERVQTFLKASLMY